MTTEVGAISQSGEETEDEIEARTKRRIKELVEELAHLMRPENGAPITTIAFLNQPKLVLKREEMEKECECLISAMQDDNLRRQTLEVMWHHCWYQPVRVYSSKMRQTADKRDQSWLWMFIKCAVGKLTVLVEKHASLSHPAFLHIGDLYRYSYVSCEKSEEDLACAQNSYRRAAALQPDDGRAYNQLALTHLERGEVWRAANFYVRAASMPRAYPRAIDNLAHLSAPESPSDVTDALVILKQICVDFNRSTWDTVSRQYVDTIKEQLSADNCTVDSVRTLLEQTGCLSTAVSYATKNLGVQDDRLRLYTSLIFQSWASLLEAVSSPGMEQSSTALSVLSGIAELLSHSSVTCHFVQSPTTTRRRVAVSLKLQYNSLVQHFVEALNSCALNELVKSDANESDGIVDWYLDGPLLSTSHEPLPRLRKLLGSLLFRLSHCSSVDSPIIMEEGGFKMRNGSCSVINKSVIELAKEMSPKLKISTNSTSSRQSTASPCTFQMPVYAVPTHEVLLESLRRLDNVTTIDKLTTLILPCVISQLDRMKRESTQAREAIRWLESAITAGKVNVVHPSTRGSSAADNANKCAGPLLPAPVSRQLMDELCSFLREKNLLQRQSLFATVLIASGGPPWCSPYPVLSVSTVDELLRGVTKHQEG